MRCFKSRFFLLPLAILCFLPLGVRAAPYAFFREYEPREQAFCGRLAGDDPEIANAYRVSFDAYFRATLVLRMANGREAERWESVYNTKGVWRHTEHRKGQALYDLAEYGNHGRILRFTRFRDIQNNNEMEEYIYDQSGKLMLIRVYRKGVLERVSEVRYHPSGFLFMHLIRNNGNAVIGRTLIESDSTGRPVRELTYLWGRLAKITEYRYCPHGLLIARAERTPYAHENALDPLYVPQMGNQTN
ncbi:MAG: hypothetical protein LBC99_00510 [Spirochaetota bacterium]|nr:hypothetical protein [Spirochaetota bacterium]